MTVCVLWLLLMVPWVGLHCVILVFSYHTHLLFPVAWPAVYCKGVVLFLLVQYLLLLPFMVGYCVRPCFIIQYVFNYSTITRVCFIGSIENRLLKRFHSLLFDKRAIFRGTQKLTT